MRYFAFLLASSLMLAGCGPAEPAGPRQVPKAPGEAASPPASETDDAAKVLKNLGDVEQEIFINATLDARSQSPQIKEDSMDSFKGDKTMCTITVNPPFPPELWVNFHVGARSNYEKQPVALQVRVYRDEEAIGQFSLKFGKYASLARLPDGTSPPPNNFAFNVLSGLSAAPATTLVHAEATAYLLPEGTDEEKVDPATATADDDHTTVIRSNPVRINFSIGLPAQ